MCTHFFLGWRPAHFPFTLSIKSILQLHYFRQWYRFVINSIKNGLPLLGGSPFSIHIFAENISQAQPTSHAARRISQICKANLFHCGLGISLCPTHEAGGLGDAYQSLFRMKRWMMVAIWARLARPLGARVVVLMPEMMPSATAHCMASMA